MLSYDSLFDLSPVYEGECFESKIFFYVLKDGIGSRSVPECAGWDSPLSVNDLS